MTPNNLEIVQYLQERFGSADWSRWSMHRWSFYDYVRLTNAGTSQLTFFVNPRGATDPVSGSAKTDEQTNMEKSRAFGQVYYIIRQIRTHIHPLSKNRQPAAISALTGLLTESTGWHAANPELVQLSKQGVLRLDIGQKGYFELEQPFLNAPPGFGVDITQHAANGTATAISSWYQQSPWAADVYGIDPEQLIEPEQTFDCRIEFPNGNTPTIPQIASADPNIDVGVLLDGFILRPAQ